MLETNRRRVKALDDKVKQSWEVCEWMRRSKTILEISKRFERIVKICEAYCTQGREEIIGEKDKIMEQEKNKNIIDDEDDIPILLDEIQEEAEEKAKKHDDMDDLSDLLGNIDENSDISQVIGSDDSERVKNLFDEDILEELDLPPKGKKERGRREILL